MTNANVTFLSRLRYALGWFEDLHEGEMIQTLNYRRTHLGFNGTVSQDDLVSIARVLDEVALKINSPYEVAVSMGELVPYKRESK